MDAQPRVCLLLESFFPIEKETALQGRCLARGLVARAIPTVVVTFRSPAELPPREELDGYEVHRVAPGPARWTSAGPLLRALDELRDGYDLIYSWGLRSVAVPAVLVGRTRRKAVVLRAIEGGGLSGSFEPAVESTGEAWQKLAVRPLGLSRRALLRRADHFVAPAESLAREVVKEGIPAERVSVIPPGVDLTRFRPPQPEGKARLRERLGLPERARIVCFAGRLASRKGPLVLLDAWRELVAIQTESEEALRGPQALLLFLGCGSGDRDDCEAEARRFRNENGLEGSVRFLGEVKNVADYLRAADIFALPSLRGSAPLAPIEAMACGLAVVTTLAGAPGDYVVPASNALAVPPADIPALRDALLRLLEKAGLRARLGEKASQTAQAFSEDRMVDLHAELFRALPPRSRQAVVH